MTDTDRVRRLISNIAKTVFILDNISDTKASFLYNNDGVTVIINEEGHTAKKEDVNGIESLYQFVRAIQVGKSGN